MHRVHVVPGEHLLDGGSRSRPVDLVDAALRVRRRLVDVTHGGHEDALRSGRHGSSGSARGSVPITPTRTGPDDLPGRPPREPSPGWRPPRRTVDPSVAFPLPWVGAPSEGRRDDFILDRVEEHGTGEVPDSPFSATPSASHGRAKRPCIRVLRLGRRLSGSFSFASLRAGASLDRPWGPCSARGHGDPQRSGDSAARPGMGPSVAGTRGTLPARPSAFVIPARDTRRRNLTN